MHIKKVGTGMFSLSSLGSGALMDKFSQSWIPDAVCVVSVFALASFVGWWVFERFWAKINIHTQYALFAIWGFLGGACVVGFFYVDAPLNQFLSADNSALYLQFSDEQSVPTEVNVSNITQWYAYFDQSIYVKERTQSGQIVGGFSVPPHWDIFVVFRKRPEFRQFGCSFKGPNGATCQVQTLNSLFALVTVQGDVSYGSLQVGEVSAFQ